MLAALSLVATSVYAAPEITWSVMHPTAIDTNYMARVVEKAKAYGGVDSFEVCGDCHSPYGGINGLSMLEPYPHAHAALDPRLVEKARADLNAICGLAHSIGRPLHYWHREIFLAKGLLEDKPEMLDENGEFDLLGKAYQDYLRFKIREAFKHCPKLDGVVLTLTEADYSVIHSSRPDRYPPQRVVEELVGIFAEEHERLGKRFILRSFGSNSQDYTDIIGGAKRAAAKHGFEIETKVTEADFVPWLPKNPFLKKTPPLRLGVECDALGEYLGAGYLPAAQVDRIRERVGYGREEGADRYTIRIDRVGNSIFDSAHEVNLYAYMRFIRDPSATVDEVIGEYAAKRFGAAAADMTPILRDELELVRNIHYVASNLTFHSFPLKPDLKWLKSGGIYSVYRENADLSGAKDIWSILHWMRAPSHERILAEKDAGLAFATNALATIERLEGRMPADEYARQHRAFATAVKAARALRAYTRCVVAYFEDMAAKLDHPFRLEAASQAAVGEIESMMSDGNDRCGGGTYFATAGGGLDRVYFIGLRFYCSELLREYRIERSMRRRLERPGVFDFVIPGGIYDDNRTIRTMHGAHAVTKPDRVIRYAGNDVFPNGTIAVELKGPADARVDVALDPDGVRACSVEKSWKDGVWTVVVGKKGAGYPGVLSIALVSGEKGERPTADVSFARGGWNPADFESVKSWRWDRLGEFVQRGDAIVNKVPDGMSPEDVYRKCCDASYAALVHKATFALGSTVSAKMMFDYRMAPIVVLAPELGVSAAGVPEFRDHWEVCLYDRGINVWHHWFENGRQRWHRAAAIELPAGEAFKAGVTYDLSVRVERYPRHSDLRRMTVTCDGRKFSYADERLPETFRAGIIACEGRNFFYDFKVR